MPHTVLCPPGSALLDGEPIQRGLLAPHTLVPLSISDEQSGQSDKWRERLSGLEPLIDASRD